MENEVREGRYQKPNRKTWEEFRAYYSANALPSLAKRSRKSYESTLNVFEQRCQLRQGLPTSPHGRVTGVRDSPAEHGEVKRQSPIIFGI